MLALTVVFAFAVQEAKPDAFPPGWLPLAALDDKTPWADFRKIDDKIHLYLPQDVKAVRGVFVCFVFHSQDPRELADLWRFALVTVPWPFEYDLGHNDKRNGRFKLGHPVGDAGLLLRYLEVAAKELKRPELATAPIVGWVGQNGPALCGDLVKRAPGRVLAWADGFPNRLEKSSALTSEVPFAYAWEFAKAEEAQRKAAREAKPAEFKDALSPPPDLKCRANTYGFPHGIYSKFAFFAMFLDRVIAQRLPEDGGKLRPWSKVEGWAGDYNPAGTWNPIAAVKDAKGMVDPQWFPDAYAASAWRAYHSHLPEVKLTAPVVEYRKKDGKWGGPECGFGYGAPVAPDAPLTFTADAKGFAKVEFYSGDRLLGVADKAPWRVEGVKLPRGLHALYPVGVRDDGTHSAGRPAFLTVK